MAARGRVRLFPALPLECVLSQAQPGDAATAPLCPPSTDPPAQGEPP